MTLKIKCVTFDAGGTLLYPYPSVGEIYADVLTTFNIQIHHDDIENSFNKVFEEKHKEPRSVINKESDKEWWREVVFRSLAPLYTFNNFDAVFDELWTEFACASRWNIYDGALETIHQLKAKGYQVAIMSNWDERLRILLDSLEMTDLFDTIFVSCEIGHEKPSPEIFRYAETKLNLKPRDFLHIGDSHFHDYEGATSAKWNCLIINNNKLAKPSPYTIQSFSDILNHLS